MSINISGNILTRTGFTPNNEIVSPNVVTKGLMLWLDVGNNSSYLNSANYYDCGYGCQYYASNPGCTNCNTQVKDMSGFGRDGSILGGANVAFSSVGGFMSFAAAGQRVEPSGFNNLMGANMTFSAWVYKLTNDNAYNMYMGSYLPYFSYHSGEYIYYSDNIGGSQQVVDTSVQATYPINKWYNVTCVRKYDGSTNTTMSIYVNGQFVNSGTFAGIGNSSAYQFYIGKWQVADSERFNGYVGPVMVYNIALTGEEIRQNFNADSPRFLGA